MQKQPAIYILSSKPQGTLYIGVTSNLPQRIWQHKNDFIEGFTKRDQVHQLVFLNCTKACKVRLLEKSG